MVGAEHRRFEHPHADPHRRRPAGPRADQAGGLSGGRDRDGDHHRPLPGREPGGGRAGCGPRRRGGRARHRRGQGGARHGVREQRHRRRRAPHQRRQGPRAQRREERGRPHHEPAGRRGAARHRPGHEPAAGALPRALRGRERDRAPRPRRAGALRSPRPRRRDLPRDHGHAPARDRRRGAPGEAPGARPDPPGGRRRDPPFGHRGSRWRREDARRRDPASYGRAPRRGPRLRGRRAAQRPERRRADARGRRDHSRRLPGDGPRVLLLRQASRAPECLPRRRPDAHQRVGRGERLARGKRRPVPSRRGNRGVGRPERELLGPRRPAAPERHPRSVARVPGARDVPRAAARLLGDARHSHQLRRQPAPAPGLGPQHQHDLALRVHRDARDRRR